MVPRTAHCLQTYFCFDRKQLKIEMILLLQSILWLHFAAAFLPSPPVGTAITIANTKTSLIFTNHHYFTPSKETSPQLAMAASTETLCSELFDLLAKNPGGHQNPKICKEFASKLEEYANAGADSSDVIFAIVSSVFNVDIPPPEKTKGRENSNNGGTVAKPFVEEVPIIDFDYMEQFMKDVFLTYGVTPEWAETCSEVLIEADKRGINSHGLGHLKPIYCDRMDDGILWADKPIDIISESDTTGELSTFEWGTLDRL